MVLQTRYQNGLKVIFEIERNLLKMGKLKLVFKTLNVVPPRLGAQVIKS